VSAADSTPTPGRWAGTGLDAVAFALGLALAWWQAWTTADLVWSLWLSSLVIGYAMIVWRVSEPLRGAVAGMATDRGDVSTGAKVTVLAVYAAGTLVGLAFFAFHFGMFHFVHSIFLNAFFPVGGVPSRGFAMMPVYAEVVRRYWWFLPAAALAERAAFRPKPADPADTAITPAAITARLSRGDTVMEPYKNVVRMHLLIFFFVFAHFARMENFAVYAVVYAVYFFPWRVLRPAAARS
jgi:hypothetical protein